MFQEGHLMFKTENVVDLQFKENATTHEFQMFCVSLTTYNIIMHIFSRSPSKDVK